MQKKTLRAIALRVAYHLQQKLGELHGHPLNTLVMMVSAFLCAGGPWLSEMGRALADLPGRLHEKVSRMSRFLCHSRFEVAEAFHQVARGIIETLAHSLPKSRILIALDWTDLGKFMGLWLSLPYQGRALPLSCAVLQKTVSENAMTDMELELVHGFLGLFCPEIRARIVFLADRGFAKRELFQAIEELGAHWVIRLPRNRQIRDGGSWMELRDLPMAPGQTRLMGQVECVKEQPMKVYLAIRRLRPEERDPKDDDDTWYVASSLAQGETLLCWYSKRFQIEEMFRDLKGRLNMDRHQLMTEPSVGKMMLIVALSYLVILEDGSQWRSRVDLARFIKGTARGGLSVFRIAQACFWSCLPEAPDQVEAAIIARWIIRRAA